MRIGFLVWNRFQVAHSVEVARHFDEPDFIFIDRDPQALDGFDPAWLVPYGAYSRFLSEQDLNSLDGEYDAIVSQFRPPLKQPWKRTKLVIQQYSLAKPKTAYNARWFAADRGLVYGAYSASIIGQMCPVSQVGNPRFDPYFERRLHPELVQSVRDRLDPRKKTIVYLPTWGDLNTSQAFASMLEELSVDFNVIVRPHHLASLRQPQGDVPIPGVIYSDRFPPMLDLGLYLQEVADLVVSDMSGAIFDALYCEKPVILLGEDGVSFKDHVKADESAIEVAQRDRIGPYVTGAESLRRSIDELVAHHGYREKNEALVAECFTRRGNCAALAAAAIREAVEEEVERPLLQVYAAPDFSSHLLSRAFEGAKKRRRKRKAAASASLAQANVPDHPVPAGRVAGLVARAGLSATSRIGGRSKSEGLSRQPLSMKETFKSGAFFSAGHMLERWNKKPQRARARLLYPAHAMATALRFSRWKWKSNLAGVFRDIYAPSATAGRELLEKFGMLKSAEAWYLKKGVDVPQELSDRLQVLGPIAGVLDMAARNEVADIDWQQCVSPEGMPVPLADSPSDKTVELYLLSSLSRDLKDESQRPYRSSQLQFSQNLVEQLLLSGFTVYPRLQAGIDGATPVSVSRPAFTWHTLQSGREAQFHLKIGTLFGHFIVDSRGYSGWASIAEAGIRDLIEGVDAAVANEHWLKLHAELVTGMKSKYFQAEEALPAGAKDYVFLPMQVVDDTVARLSDIDTLSLLNALAEWGGSRGVKVIVKRHPMCKSESVASALEEAERSGAISISCANIHDLVANARCVVTVNSGVGAEALLQMKPVITTGRSDYAAATHRARTVEELYAVLDAGVRLPVSEDDLKKFLWVYTKQYMVHFDDTDALGRRLRHLLSTAGCVAGETRSASTFSLTDSLPGVTSIPFFTGKRLSTDGQVDIEDLALGEQCDELLRAFSGAGVKCWLDSGSLLGLVRYGRLNDWEKDIDLGIWIDDFQRAREVCKAICEKYSLWYREKSVQGVPYALLLSSYPEHEKSTLPISVHAFSRINDHAWCPQPYSLVSARAKYPRFVYREKNGETHARVRQKLSFLYRYPEYSACILAEKLNMTARIGRSLKRIECADSLKERLLSRIFLQTFQWKVPAHYFEQLKPISADHPHVLVPVDVDDYLEARYGDWRIPVKGWFYVVDDGCIAPVGRSDLDDCLAAARKQMSSGEPDTNGVLRAGDTLAVGDIERPGQGG